MAETEKTVCEAVKEPKASTSNSDATPQISKAEAKRLRREKQEAQRAAKAAAKQDGAGQKKDQQAKQQQQPKPPKQKDDGQKKVKFAAGVESHKIDKIRNQELARLEKPEDPPAKVTTEKPHHRRTEKRVPKLTTESTVPLFGHLIQNVKALSLTEEYQFNTSQIHPAILALGVKYADGIICGSNARCVALLAALKELIRDYSTPQHKDLARDLSSRLNPNINYLKKCRPISVSMGNAIKYLKSHINSIPSKMHEHKAKKLLFTVIDNFVHEKIKLARTAISQILINEKKIQDGDVILTFGHSSLIKYVLCEAQKKMEEDGTSFRVIVVDSRPKLEGQQMLRQLVDAGIECSYCYVTAVSYVMQEASKVLLGAHALLSNGFVMSRAGTSQVAMVAKAFNVPVLVCCETYKFSEGVQTDSFVINELADPNDLIDEDNEHLKDWQSMKSLNLLNLVYDVTPPDLVTGVVTEIAMMPCTSVPVVLRVKFGQE